MLLMTFVIISAYLVVSEKAVLLVQHYAHCDVTYCVKMGC